MKTDLDDGITRNAHEKNPKALSSSAAAAAAFPGSMIFFHSYKFSSDARRRKMQKVNLLSKCFDALE